MKSIVPERFFSKVQITEDCWNWLASKFPTGYGHFFYDSGKGMYAHRWSYEFAFGPIPTGLQLDHLCRNPACVNPDHLEAVTPAVNVLRSTNPAAINAGKLFCKHGHPLGTGNFYLIRRSSGRTFRYCKVCSAISERKRRNAAKQRVNEVAAS